MITAVCKFCGKQFRTNEAWIRNGRGKFCSRECGYADRRRRTPKPEFVCNGCGKTFHVVPSKLVYSKTTIKYCSRECYESARNKDVTKTCRLCGKTYSIKHSKKDLRNDFCSKKCWYEYSIGENNPNWRGGSSFEPYCPKFNNAKREEVRDRYGRKCLSCGLSEDENISKSGRHIKLAVHHIRYDKTEGCDGKEMWLCPLCMRCHSRTNGNRDEWQALLEEKKKIFDEGLYDSS